MSESPKFDPGPQWDDCYVICPYCGNEMGDAWDWSSHEDWQEHECDECEKTFMSCAEYDVTYRTKAKGE